MILIPEIETVVILVPRTGSGSLRRAIAKAYPQSMLLYRHMEADGVPQGYDRWRRVGVVREPVGRLWSLYKWMRDYVCSSPDQGPAYVAELRRAAARPFDEWIVNNEAIFSNAFDRAGDRWFPRYAQRHSQPETRKSQQVWLRPDLGTEVWRYQELSWLALDLDVELERQNGSAVEPCPPLGREAIHHVERFFAWDLEAMNSAKRGRL